MTKNSLKNGPDELGYYGEGENAMGGMAVGETLMPALHELNLAFEDAIKDKAFLDEFAYYCKHYIGRPSPLYHAENLSNKLGGAKIFPIPIVSSRRHPENCPELEITSVISSIGNAPWL